MQTKVETSFSTSEENYIKSIYSLSTESLDSISTNILAEKMNTKASSVTDMIKRLSDKGLVTYLKYRGCELTEEGKKIALAIVRKHRLWEVFLVEKLNFGWDEVHDIAEQLEHIQSKKLTDQLDAYLGFPTVDPHGDPIPNELGIFPTIAPSKSLFDSSQGQTVQVIGVVDGSTEFLKYLNTIELRLGSLLFVKEKLNFDGSVIVLLNEQQHTFSKHIARRIFIQQSN